LPSRSAAKSAPAALDLARAMRLARPPETVSVRRAPDEVMFRTGPVEARARWTYGSAYYIGFVVEVANAGNEPVHLDPRRFAGRDLVLVGVRESVIPAKSKTLLYLIFWR
jgi:hypothetical protein